MLPPYTQEHPFKDKEKAEKEYRASIDLERKLGKKLFKKYSPIKDEATAKGIVDLLSRSLGVPLVRLRKLDVVNFSYYESVGPKGTGVIVLCLWADMRALLHEFAHHVVYVEGWRASGNGSMFHSKDFLLALEMVYEAYREVFGK